LTDFTDFWQRFDRRARFGLTLGAAVIVVATAVLGAWAFRTDYQVLFADLAPQDAATMTAELDQMKIAYRLSGGGNTILVPADMVYKTRLKLAGKELPLRGAVGFELFNNSEVGMTEFAQKINYQRALQGELTRTIQSLDEIQSVRVHLVLAEQALFKKSGTQPKASITIAVKPGKMLDPAQIQGIQRLVGAAVPDIKPYDVTILDQHGVALTRKNSGQGEETGGAVDGLDEKRAIESYLNKKVVEVLDRTFGAGQGIASVDVTLNHEHKKTTTESPLVSNSVDDNLPTGVVLREKQSTRESSHGGESSRAATGGGDASLLNREVEYQVGRRVEQVVSAAGAIQHVKIAVVVRASLDPAQLERLKDVVAMAAGISKERGDAVAVYSVDQMSTIPASDAVIPAAKAEPEAEAETGPGPKTASAKSVAGKSDFWQLLLAGALAVALLLFWRMTAPRPQARPLSEQERKKMLAQVNDWLHDAQHQSMEHN